MVNAFTGNGFWDERRAYLAALADADGLLVTVFDGEGRLRTFSSHNVADAEWSPSAAALAKLSTEHVPVLDDAPLTLADGRSARAVCIAPMVAHDRLVGAVVAGRVSHEWEAADRLVLLRVAGLAAVDLKEAAAFRQHQESSAQLVHRARAEHALYQEMHRTDGADALLAAMPHRLADRFAADRVSLMLVDGDALVVKSAVGLREEIVRQTRPRIGEGIAGWVAKHGEPLLLKGAVEEARFRGVDPSISSAIVAPLVAVDRIVGVVNVNGRDGVAQYERYELDALAAIGADLGLAIMRSGASGLFVPPSARERRQMQVLFELSRLTMFGRPGRNLDDAAALVADVMDHPVVGLWLLRGTEQLRLAASRGYPSVRSDEAAVQDDSAIRSVIADAEAALVEACEPRGWSSPAATMYIVAPIVADGTVRGVVVLGRENGTAPDGDLEFASLLGAYLGVMLVADERRRGQLSALAPAHERLATGLTDVVLTLEVLQRLLGGDPTLPARVAKAAREAHDYLSDLDAAGSVVVGASL